MTPFIAELLGTMILILLGDGVVANVVLKNTKGNGSGWMVITTAWALAVFTAVVVAGPYSGAHINPAVTISLALSGAFPWEMVPSYILAQLIGAFIGAALVWIFYYDHFTVSDNCDDKRAIFCTGPAIRNLKSNFICEVIGTFVLMFGIFYISNGSFIDTGSSSTVEVGLGSIGAIPVAFIVWVVGLALGGTTGYAINPARDLGPRIAHQLLPIQGKSHSDWSYAWVPILGPITGGVLATVLFMAL